MTKKEALTEMEKGVKITHRHFARNEWMTLYGKKFVFEDGVRCTQAEFWTYRRSKDWDNDYSIYNNK